MKELAEHERGFNRNPSIWTEEFRINGREYIRAELCLEVSGDYSISLRRWIKADDGTSEPTKKGLACSIKHLPAIVGLMNKALQKARAIGLLRIDEGADV
jgi:hypothetical protein